MSVQGYGSLNGIVSNPYSQAQASAIAPVGLDQNNMAQNAILTGNAPLASAVAPSAQQNQAIATSQASAIPTPAPQQEQMPQLAENKPLPEGCGNNLNCVA